LQGCVKSALKREHQGVGMFAVEFGRKLAVGFETSGKRLFEQDPVSGFDQHGGVFAVILRGRDNHGSVTNARIGQLLDRREDWNFGAHLHGAAASVFHVDICQPGKDAATSFLGQFVDVQSMDHSHAANSGNGNFQWFRHVRVFSDRQVKMNAQCTPPEGVRRLSGLFRLIAEKDSI
jgi:hypothetical protein